MTNIRVLRIFHGGHVSSNRARDREIARRGVDLTLVIPSVWPDPRRVQPVDERGLLVRELAVSSPGDVNRHKYLDPGALRAVINESRPDLVDVQEEPFSAVAHQVLSVIPATLPVVMSMNQNIDKRLPIPFAQYERAAYRRISALYPCSSQAASVARGKGLGGIIDVLPLGFEQTLFTPGNQSLDDEDLMIAFVGRLVREKGVTDAVRVLATVNATRPARLVVAGTGPEERVARALSARLGILDRVEFRPWQSSYDLAQLYRDSHLLLLPSMATNTWVEQFGCVIVEAQASGAIIAGYASGAIPEVAGDAGLLALPGDVEDLASQVLGLADDHGEYLRRRELGIALSRTCTWTHVAERQVALYRRVLRGDSPRMQMSRSPRERRRLAREEFGSPARTTAGERPFALPILRQGGIVPRVLAASIDGALELAGRVPRIHRVDV
jgi:glycosyltransferase involved in cell wall biosynthesis